ncbi:MAG: phosphoribosylformylglycinamidine synthase [Eubacteriales bacterium]|nr:phosphoribosylformylglycinamidine synthase [Eubacteriales bacterium]
MVNRIYVEKKKGLTAEADSLLCELRDLLGIRSLSALRVVNRYDLENIEPEVFEKAVRDVLSEPQLDTVSTELSSAGQTVFAVEYLPGQFDQRADSAAQCIELLSPGAKPLVRSAKVYLLSGDLTDEDLDKIKKYVINPVEAREASAELPETLSLPVSAPAPVPVLSGFTACTREELADFVARYGLAMDTDDAVFCRDYFKNEEKRDPTLTEIRVIDTYWSDHCRHTTFHTVLEKVTFDDPVIEKTYEDYLSLREKLGVKKPRTLMDLATVAVKGLKAAGKLSKLDESEEINACTVKITVEKDGKKEPWLLLFKNETHNHPTEIEPFGGAATCIGGAIRDPLSGRSYVYGAMRVTGAADPLTPIEQTIPGKLPQRKIVTTAAAGYSSYGNQIGLATGVVDEIYHPGYAAKRMEIGAVVGATPADHVRREVPAPGDSVILLGGATGRDGCGGATGSSKSHNAHSLETCGAEVQKGNAPEERKLQRLFRNGEACRLIKRCNDFGAGGVSVAIGELADGLSVSLDAVPKKYEGLDGTELAISESQERMAVVVAPEDTEAFLALAAAENLSATKVATVTKEARLVMTFRGQTVVNVSREFLSSNGAPKATAAHVVKSARPVAPADASFTDGLFRVAGDLNTCSKRGLSERFDSTIGAGTVLMPFGGKNQLTPIQAMVQKLPVADGHTDDCSFMAFGYNPFISEKSPYHGAYLAVVESISKLIATGADFSDVYLSFQEYFPRPGQDENRWGLPLAALLGAFRAQCELGVGAIGGKDSMSGSFEHLDVPPTLVSFAVTTGKAGEVVSPEFKGVGHPVVCLSPDIGADGLPVAGSLLALFGQVTALCRAGRVLAAYTPGMGGVCEAVMKMAFGNSVGFTFEETLTGSEIFDCRYGSFLLEMADEATGLPVIGHTTAAPELRRGGEAVTLSRLLSVYEGKLESVYSCNRENKGAPVENFSYQKADHPANGVKKAAPAVKTARPKFLIPVFPGTNCEFDSAKAVCDAGGEAEIFVIRNRTPEDIKKSVSDFARSLSDAQAVFIPGGFSGGDEPDGSGKFITAFFRNEAVRAGVTDLLDNRGGLMCGICNGFQALIKLGLVPFGRITEGDAFAPTLTYNTIGRHQSRIVRTRVASNKSPWLSFTEVGDIFEVPVSHGEGRFLCDEKTLRALAQNGQIATQYVDLSGQASTDIHFNPNDSVGAVEGITSPDGRVFGKMGHSERVGTGLYRNVPGCYQIRMFESAVHYFKS